MNKSALYFLTIMVSMLIAPTESSASDVSVGVWHATGSQTWQTTFPLHTTTVDGASELIYPNSDKYVTVNYEKKISKDQSLHIEGGTTADRNSNIGSDSDWDYSQSPDLWYYGQFKTSNKSHFITVDLKHHNSNNTDFFYGYTYNISHYSMTDGLYSIMNYGSVNNPLPNLNSHYTMIYQGPHIGVIHKVPLTDKLTAIGSISYSPWALAQGHGWWNLRNLDFEHVGSAQMVDTNIGLRFALNPKDAAITLGYRYQYFSLYKGWENLSSDITWNKATNIKQGYYFAGEMKF